MVKKIENLIGGKQSEAEMACERVEKRRLL